MKRIVVSSLFALALAGGASIADAKQFRFAGIHPIAKGAGGGFCHIEVPHVHAYQPGGQKRIYREHGGEHRFVGDPVAHGYDGPRHSYYGHHPLQVHVAAGAPVNYCYLDGPHYHVEEPLEDAPFVVRGGVYFYSGDYAPEYEAERADLVQINAVYRPMRYERPVYVEAPPAEYHGPILTVSVGAPVVVAEPVYVEPARPVVVERPVVRAGVEVYVPLPSFHVEIGGPAVVVGAPHHHHDVVVVDRRHHHGKKYKHRNDHRRRGRWFR